MAEDAVKVYLDHVQWDEVRTMFEENDSIELIGSNGETVILAHAD